VRAIVQARRPLGMKPLYTTIELAAAIGITQERVVRLLKAQRVFVYNIGKSCFVPLSEIEEKLQPLWESILTNERNCRKRE